jgi:tetratricopeptide (TPR) repeat protein
MGTEPNELTLRGTVAFTGRLASMARAEAFDLVRRKGGSPRRGVTKTTDVLVVGQMGWPLLADGLPSKSLHLAKRYGVAVASEQRFLEWVGKATPSEHLKTYTPAQLSALSKMPPEVVEQLTEFGLLDIRQGHYGFRDVAAARQIGELFQSGVTLSTITKSLHEIRKWLPDAGLSNLRLYPASSDAILIEHLKGRTDKTGQFMLPVGESRDHPDTLFEQAQAAEHAQDFETAIRLYRKIMRLDPSDPAAPFNLGNILYSTGKKIEAEVAYRAAIKADPGFTEAWYNLAGLLEDQGRIDSAVDCLKRALSVDSNYASAIFNLALLLQSKDDTAEAAACWRRYLELDTASAWAARAKKALKYCEMRIAQSS